MATKTRPEILEQMQREIVDLRGQIIELVREGTLLATDLDRIDRKFIEHTGSKYEGRIGTVERWERLTGADCKYRPKAGQ